MLYFTLCGTICHARLTWAKRSTHFGREALYAVAVISGLTDVDAITLSTALLFQNQTLEATTAWRVILIATLANLVFQGLAATFLGSRRLMIYLAMLFGLSLFGGVLILLYWPGWKINFSPLREALQVTPEASQ